MGAPRHSQLFKAAVDLEVGDNFGLLRRTIFSKDGRDIRWHSEMEAPRWNSALRACRAVLDLSCRQDRDRAEVIRDAVYTANPGYDLLSSLPTMTVYHRTSSAAEILRVGFHDGSGTYLTDQMLSGVWVSTSPLDKNEGASGNALVQIEIPTKILLKYECIESGKCYREFLVPAEVLNQFGPPVLVDESKDDLELLVTGTEAQSQCRATLETLATIKNPSVVFARQANIAQGPQQVNNAMMPAPRAGAGKTEKRQ